MNVTEYPHLGKPKRCRDLSRIVQLQGRRLIGVYGFSQTEVRDIEDDESVWLLEFEGGWWARLVMQYAPAYVSPTCQLAWDVYGPDIEKPAMVDARIEHLPGTLIALIGTRFVEEGPCVSTEMIVLEDRLCFEVDGDTSGENKLVMRIGYLNAAETYLRTGKLVGLGNKGLDAQVVPPCKIAEMDDWELKRRLQHPMRHLGLAVLEQWLVSNHFPACAAPWDDVEHIARLRLLRQALTEFLKWFRPSHKLSDSAVSDPKRPKLKWSWPAQLAVLEDAWERLTAWELLVNAGLAVSPDTGDLVNATANTLARGDELQRELPVFALDAMFTPTWWVNADGSKRTFTDPAKFEFAAVPCDAKPTWVAYTGSVPTGLIGEEIPSDFLWANEMITRYGPVRQAYEEWRLRFLDCQTQLPAS